MGSNFKEIIACTGITITEKGAVKQGSLNYS